MSDVLFYEVLSMTLNELENKREIKLNFINPSNDKEREVSLLIDSSLKVSDLIDLAHPYVKMNAENGKLCILEVLNNRISRVLLEDEEISALNSYSSLYVDEIPNCLVESKSIFCFSYYRSPSNSHGIPFILQVPKATTFEQLKPKIQEKLMLSDKEFLKCKFSLVYYTKAEPIEDSTILYDLDASSFHQLGIDHLDKSGNSMNASRYEKAIKIRS